jgi:hypothetical protein
MACCYTSLVTMAPKERALPRKIINTFDSYLAYVTQILRSTVAVLVLTAATNMPVTQLKHSVTSGYSYTALS